MTASILALLGALIPFVIWLWKRRVSKQDDKYQQHEARVQEANSAIARGNADAVTRQLDDELRWLRSHAGDSSGQSNGKTSVK